MAMKDGAAPSGYATLQCATTSVPAGGEITCAGYSVKQIVYVCGVGEEYRAALRGNVPRFYEQRRLSEIFGRVLSRLNEDAPMKLVGVPGEATEAELPDPAL